MKKLRKVGKKSSFNKILGGVSGICLLLFLLTFALEPITCGDFFIGTTISALDQESGHGAKTYLIVKLDDRRRVEVKQTVASGPMVQGKRLIVQECTTRILKRKSFQFIKNIETQSNLSEEQQLKEVKNRNGV